MVGQTGNLHITVVEGHDLKAMDGGKSSDPYLKLYVNKVEVAKTATIKKTLYPVWNAEFDLSIEDASLITFNLYDYDRIGSNELMGTGNISVPLKELELVDVWVPVSTRGQVHFLYQFTPADLLGDSRATDALGMRSTAEMASKVSPNASSEMAHTKQTAAVTATLPHGYGFGNQPLPYMTAAGYAATAKPCKLDPVAVFNKHGMWPLVHYVVFVSTVFVMGRMGLASVFALGVAWVASAVAETYMGRAVRDDVREFADAFGAANYRELESSRWLNDLMEKVVRNYAITIEQEVVKRAQEALNDVKLPGMALIFKAFVPGSNGPKVHDWHVHRGGLDKDLTFDVRVEWAGDFRMVIEVKQAVGAMVLVIQNLNVECQLRISARLLKGPPFVSYVWVQMPQKPLLDVDIQGLGAEIPGVIPLIKSKIIDTISDMMVFPKRFEVDVAGANGVEVDPEDRLSAAPDPASPSMLSGAINVFKAPAAGAVGAVTNIGRVGVGAVGSLGKGIMSLGGKSPSSKS